MENGIYYFLLDLTMFQWQRNGHYETLNNNNVSKHQVQSLVRKI